MINSDYITFDEDNIYINRDTMIPIMHKLRGATLSVLISIGISEAQGTPISNKQLMKDTQYSAHSICKAKKNLRELGLLISDISTRKNHTKNDITNELRWKIWDRDNFTCKHCGTRIDLTVDHIIPKSKGGPTVEINLQTLCRRCNSKKGTNHDQAI